jgi:hypothetical protein
LEISDNNLEPDLIQECDVIKVMVDMLNGLQQSIGKIFVLYGIVSGTKYFKPPNTKQKLVIFTYDVRMSHDHHFNYKFKIRNPVLFS